MSKMSKGETILHKVITGVPINTTAAMVTQNGQHFDPENAADVRHWEICPPLKDPPPNLTGKFFGNRMQVMGLWAEGNGKWVCRCKCGHFELRRAAAICNPINYGDCCYKCMAVKKLRRNSTYKNTGEWPDDQMQGA